MLAVKAIAIALLVVSASVVVASAFLSNYFDDFTLNPSSNASAITDTYSPPANYSLTITSGNCGVNILSSPDNTLSATLNVTSSFFLKASARIDASSLNGSYDFQLVTPQYWGINAIANVYIPTGISSSSITVSLQNGAINAEVPNVVHEISLQTSNGQISLRGQSVNAVNTETTNGNTFISVFAFATITSSTVNGNVQLTVGSASSSGSIALSTINGNVNYYADPSSNLTLSANTVNGAVSVSVLAYDATISNTRQLVGTVNGGGTSVVLATVNGNIKIGSSLPVI